MIPGGQTLSSSSLSGEDDEAGKLVCSIAGVMNMVAALERTAAPGTVGVDEAIEIAAAIAAWNDIVAETATDIAASTEA